MFDRVRNGRVPVSCGRRGLSYRTAHVIRSLRFIPDDGTKNSIPLTPPFDITIVSARIDNKGRPLASIPVINMSGKPAHSMRIQFLGQCIALGGAGVELPSAYPSLTKQLLSAEFPNVSFKVSLKQLAHPFGLKPLVRASLLLFKPDIMLISLPGIFATAPRPVNLIDMIAPEVLYTARSFLMKVHSRIRSDSAFWRVYKRAPNLLPRGVYPPLAVHSYRASVEEAIRYCLQSSTCRPVLIGPGGFNEDAKDDWLPSLDVYRAVNEMVLQVGKQLDVPVIDATAMMAEQHNDVFQPRTHVWSERGHQVMAREIEYVLASQLRGIGMHQD